MKELILKVFRVKEEEKQKELDKADEILTDTIEDMIKINEELLKEGMNING